MDTRNEYRVVGDNFAGYEAQFRPWWSPWWFQCFGINTRSSPEGAEAVAIAHASPVVKRLGRLP